MGQTSDLSGCRLSLFHLNYENTPLAPAPWDPVRGHHLPGVLLGVHGSPGLGLHRGCGGIGYALEGDPHPTSIGRRSAENVVLSPRRVDGRQRPAPALAPSAMAPVLW